MNTKRNTFCLSVALWLALSPHSDAVLGPVCRPVFCPSKVQTHTVEVEMEIQHFL